MQQPLDPHYIDRCLRTGQYVEISSPRPQPPDKPKRLKQRQREIEHQALAACELAGTTQAVPVAAFDTRDRLVILAIEPPQASLGERPQEEVFTRQKVAARAGRARAEHLHACVASLNSGEIRTYADLCEFCGGHEEVIKDLRAIRKLSGSDVSVQTIDGATELHLGKVLQTSLSGDKQVICSTAYYGMNADHGEILVQLRLDSHQIATALAVSGRPVRTVRLATDNNLRALKILQGLAYIDEEAEVVVGSAFRLADRRWELVMHGFADEYGTVKSLGSLASLLPD